MKHIKLILFCVALQLTYVVTAQNTNTLQGRVVDLENKPLENVNIAIKNTKKGTVTDVKGNFELATTSNKVTLLISNLGFEKQEVLVSLLKNKVTNVLITLNPTTYKLEEIVVNSNPSLVKSSVTKSLKRQKVIAGATNVVAMKSLNTKRSLTLKDALEMQPGVIIQEFFGANDQPRLNIRGSGIQSNPQRRGINLLQDGISTNFADGSYIIGVLEPRAANHIEVFRGANGLKYGATTLGGAINLVSKNGYTASSPLEIHLEGGSFNYYGGSISSGFVSGKTDGYASVSYNDAKGFRGFNTSARLNAMLNLGQKITDKFETRLYATYTNLKFDIPGPLTQMQLDKDPTVVSLGVKPPKSLGPNVVRDKPGRMSDVFRIANKNTYKVNNNSDLSIGLYYQYADDTFTFPVSVGVRNSISNDFGSYLAFTTKTTKNNLSLGVNASTGKMARKYYVNIKGEKGKLYANNDLTATNLVFYAEDIYKFTPKLSGILTAQLSINSRNNKDIYATPTVRPFFNFKTKKYGTFASTNTSLNQDFVGFNPKLGLIYDATENNQLFFNVSRSYEPPTFDELVNQAKANPNKSPEVFKSVKLNAQTGTTIEVGSRGTFKAITWDVSFYHSWIKDEILTTTDLFGISGSTRNSPDVTIHQGLELGLQATLFKNIFTTNNDVLQLKTVYNFSNFYFNEGIYKDKQIAGIPKHHIAASLEYKHPTGIFASINTEWLPEKTPTDHRNTVFQKPYQIFGFRVGYSKSKWGVFVEGKNITDEIYTTSYLIRDVVANPKPPLITAKNVTTFNPGASINFSGGIYYKF